MKKIISIMLTVLLLFVAAGTYGCYKKEVYGDFIYGIRGERKYADILGLSEEGRNKEVIYIPKEINGYPVSLIGRTNRSSTYNKNTKD